MNHKPKCPTCGARMKRLLQREGAKGLTQNFPAFGCNKHEGEATVKVESPGIPGEP